MPAQGVLYLPSVWKSSTRAVSTKKRRHNNDSAPRGGSDEFDKMTKRQHIETSPDQCPRLLDAATPNPSSSTTASTLEPQLSASTNSIQRKRPRAPITTSAYRAKLQTLEKVLRQELITRKHGAAHEHKQIKTGWCWCKAGSDK